MIIGSAGMNTVFLRPGAGCFPPPGLSSARGVMSGGSVWLIVETSWVRSPIQNLLLRQPEPTPGTFSLVNKFTPKPLSKESVDGIHFEFDAANR